MPNNFADVLFYLRNFHPNGELKPSVGGEFLRIVNPSAGTAGRGVEFRSRVCCNSSNELKPLSRKKAVLVAVNISWWELDAGELNSQKHAKPISIKECVNFGGSFDCKWAQLTFYSTMGTTDSKWAQGKKVAEVLRINSCNTLPELEIGLEIGHALSTPAEINLTNDITQTSKPDHW